MKFEEENSVEILKGENGASGLWFPGRIISEVGEYYVVKYESVAESLIEKVKKENVRPKPPLRRGKRWIVGDVAQVFDIRCWRVGKIVKVLKKGIFVIRLVGSIQLKEFHESSLRIWQTWHQTKWSVVGKGAISKESTKIFLQNEAKFCGRLDDSSNFQVKGKNSCLRKRDVQKHHNSGQNKVKKCLPVRKANRSNIHCLDRSSKALLSCVGGSNLPSFRQAGRISSRQVRPLEKFNEGSSNEMEADIAKAATHISSRILSPEDSDQCSVASCSSNNPIDPSPCQNCNEAFADSCDNSDAESSFPSSSPNIDMTLYFKEKLEADIHELEFNAYKTTVRALYASGPLSWEQESLLTNLRLCLHISDEEHLLQLRHLLSSHVVKTSVG